MLDALILSFIVGAPRKTPEIKEALASRYPQIVCEVKKQVTLSYEAFMLPIDKFKTGADEKVCSEEPSEKESDIIEVTEAGQETAEVKKNDTVQNSVSEEVTATEETQLPEETEVTAPEETQVIDGNLLWDETVIEPVTIYPTTVVNIRNIPSSEDGEIIGRGTIDDSFTAVAEVRKYNGADCFFYKLDDGRFVTGLYTAFEKTKAPASVITIDSMPTVIPDDIEYYSCGNTITLPPGNYNIDTDYIGMKVVWTNMALRGTTEDRFSAATKKAVMNLQKESGLPETGVVDLSTWLAMGYSEDDWNNLGTYVTPLKVSPGASHEECVEKMIETATEYMNAGTDYRIGCSGYPGSYVDCSGLIFQCLYSIGINPTINIVDHALAVKEYTSRDLCADIRLGVPVAYEDMQAGDIVFFTSDGRTVCHVGLSIGDGKMLDSNTGGVKIRNMRKRSQIVKIVRVCP